MKLQVINLLLVNVIVLGACSTTPIPITAPPVQTAFPTAERFEFSMLSQDGTMRIQSRDWVLFEIIELQSNKVLGSFSYDRTKFDKNDMEGGYGVYYWSRDGRFIYVMPYQGWDGGVKYYGNVFGAREGLARFDLDTRTMVEILPERYGGGYTFGISPDENRLVYVDQRETPLILRSKDLSTGDEKALFTFDEQTLDIGAYEWSPEMDELLFMGLEVQNPGRTDGSQKLFYSFFLLALENPPPHRILQGFDKRLDFDAWQNKRQVTYKGEDSVIWQLDFDTETLTPIGTVTPSP